MPRDLTLNPGPELTHPLDAHGYVAAADETDGLQIPNFHRCQDVSHFAAKDDDLIAKIQMRHGLEPDASREIVKTLTDLAQGLVTCHCRKFLEKIHVDARVSLGIRCSHEPIASRNDRPHALQVFRRTR